MKHELLHHAKRAAKPGPLPSSHVTRSESKPTRATAGRSSLEDVPRRWQELTVGANYQRILQEASVASNLSESLDVIARRVKTALGLDAYAVYLIENDADQYVLMGSAGKDGPSDFWERLDRHDSALGMVHEQKEVVTLAAPAALPPGHPLIAEDDAPFEELVGMPLVHLQRVLDVLVGWKKASRELEPNELTCIVSVASWLASNV